MVFSKSPSAQSMIGQEPRPKGYKPKKLIAYDSSDLEIFSALLQDAALTPADIHYDPKRQRFAITLNRLIQEDKGFFKRSKAWRQRCGLHFDHVTAVRHQAFSRESDVLALLAVNGQEDEDNGRFRIRLIFAANVVIELLVDSIDAFLTDLGEPWEAIARPNHDESS